MGIVGILTIQHRIAAGKVIAHLAVERMCSSHGSQSAAEIFPVGRVPAQRRGEVQPGIVDEVARFNPIGSYPARTTAANDASA